MLVVDDEPLARERVITLLPPATTVVVGEAWSRASAVSAIRRLEPDLVFLDVEMPDGPGFDVLADVSAEQTPVVVFVTAYDDYAIRAFDAAAVDYLLKPIDPARLSKALERALTRLTGTASAAGARPPAGTPRDTAESRQIVLRERDRSYFVDTERILWIESKRNNCLVHFVDLTIAVRETLTALSSRLPRERFARAHRSVVVNLQHLRYAEPYFRGEYVLVLSDGTRLTTSRGMGTELHQLLRAR